PPPRKPHAARRRLGLNRSCGSPPFGRENVSYEYDWFMTMKSSATQPVQPLIRIGSFWMAPEELAGLFEIAEMLGVTRRTVQRYMDRDDFPEPLGEIAARRV